MRFRYLLLPIALLCAIPDSTAQSELNVHVVESGDTLFGIAARYNVSVPHLRDLNNLEDDTIYVGQRLRLSRVLAVEPRPAVGAGGEFVPSLPETPVSPVPDDPPPPLPVSGEITTANIPGVAAPPSRGSQQADADTQRVHVVQPGETLFAIALRYNTTVQDLRRRNSIDGDVIEVGQRLLIEGTLDVSGPDIHTPRPFSLTSTTVAADLVHFTDPGETLYAVAARLRIPLDALLSVNNLTTAPLEPGTMLYLPRAIDLRELREPGAMLPPDTTGLALVYPSAMEGRRMANGLTYDPDRLMASHRTLPLGTVVLVSNPTSGRSAFVEILDRGPVSQSYLIELSRAAAEALELDPNSARRVELRRLP